MTILILDPRGEVARPELPRERALGKLTGKRIGYLFNQHKSGVTFWKALEQEIAKHYAPASVRRIYKENTWAPAPQADVARLIAETDFALVGLGA